MLTANHRSIARQNVVGVNDTPFIRNDENKIGTLPVTIAAFTEAQFGQTLQHFLRPSKPVKEPQMLHGRQRQLELIRQALYADGRSIFIYGERGVGKSSLARVAASQYRGDRGDFLYVLCEPTSTLESVLVTLARHAGVTETNAQERSHTFTARLGKIFETCTRAVHRSPRISSWSRPRWRPVWISRWISSTSPVRKRSP